MNKKIIAGVLFIFTIMLVVVYLYRGGERLIVVKDNTIATTTTIGGGGTIANPASVNCIKKGGHLKTNKRGDGAEYTLCYFEESRACEEWALYTDRCPVGGRKTTGYDTIDQNYCVWNGGKTLAMTDSQCTFITGKVCSTIDFYNGVCSN